MDRWVKLVGKSNAQKHGEIVKWLKNEHGVTHGYANLIAHQYLNVGAPVQDDDALVDMQYAGKEPLRPIFDRLKERISGFGSDVEFAPKKA